MRALMTVACATCLASVVMLLVPPGSAPRRLSRLSVTVEEPVGPSDGLGRRIDAVLLMVSALAVVGAGLWFGASAAVVAAAVTATSITVTRLLRRQLLERQRDGRRVEVARACAAVSAQARVGRVPTDALLSAAQDHRVLRPAARTQQLGGDVVRSLHALARAPGQGGLAELARAWEFCVRTGAPMAGALDQVAISLRDDQATQRTVAAELAGPRASGLVMAVLPLLGIGLGYLIGGDPVGFLVGGPVGWTCLLAGTGLALVGVGWLDRLARVSEPGQQSPSGGTG